MLIKKANHCDSSEKSSSGHLIYCSNSLLNFKCIQFQDIQGCAQTNMSHAKQNKASSKSYLCGIQTYVHLLKEMKHENLLKLNQIDQYLHVSTNM